VGEVMDEAWRLVKGMKGTFWAAAIVVGLIYLLFDTVFEMVFAAGVSKAPNLITKQLFQEVIGALMTPVTMGIQMMCVRRALGAPISFGTAFSYFSRSGTALAAAFLVMLLTDLGLVALVIPGIYLALAYSMTTQLVCDQGLTAWQAMEVSRRAITHHWWSVLGLGLLVGLLTVVSALGLLIPLIWTVPWALMTSGVLYRRIFYATRAPVADGPPVVAPIPPG
jgi:uncharacterized membrane protein